MIAIYRGHVCHITDSTGDGVILDGEVFVSFAEPSLVIEPTDAQVKAAEAGDEIPYDPGEEELLAEIASDLGFGHLTDELIALNRETRPVEMNRRT